MLAIVPVLVLVTYVYCESRSIAIKKGNIQTAHSLQLDELPSNKTYFGVKLFGDAAYRLQVAKALRLLSLSDPEALSFVTNNIRIIIEMERSGIWILSNTPVFSLSRTSAFHSITWCAGVMVHDANHALIDLRAAKQQRNHELSFRELQAMERVCIRRQIKTLKNIGAPRAQIDYLRSCEGTHFDVNGDGRYDWSDVHAQRW